LKKLGVFIKLHSIIGSLIFDVFLGLTVSFLLYNANRSSIISQMKDIASLSDRLKYTVEWMMGFPYGFKPNKELDNFLGGCMISLLDGCKTGSWIIIVAFGTYFIKFLIFIGIFGFTIQVSIIHDLGLYMSTHLHFVYIFFTSIYWFCSKLLVTLFKMQRGVKFNIRIKRNEVEEFSVDEMMLGMAIFLIIVFLMPTIIMYYVCGVTIMLFLVFI